MIPKIENRTYSYQGAGVCNIAATLNIYDGETIIASLGLSASYDISQPDFAAEIGRQLTTQVNYYMGKLIQLDALRLARFPASTNFTTAVDQIFDPIQASIGGQ